MSGSSKESSCSQSRIVKVFIEGDRIGRKVDLFAFNNYESLAASLSNMFDTTVGYGEGNSSVSSNHHTLMFLDKDGDWMMVGDISWDNFLITAQRLFLEAPKNPETLITSTTRQFTSLGMK